MCTAKKVVPVSPVVSASVCRVGSSEPSEPVVSLASTEGLVYEMTSSKVEGGKFVYTVTAKPVNEAVVVDGDKLPDGWSVPDSNGVSTFSGSVDLPKCAELVVPRIDAGSCPAGSLTPSDPSVTFSEVAGLRFESKWEIVDGKVKVSATATPEAGYQIGGDLPAGWVVNADGSATFAGSVDRPVCKPTQVTLVSPKIVPGVCKPGSSKPVDPIVQLPKVPGLSYGTPVIKVSDGKVTITVTATPEAGRVIKKSDLPAGWTVKRDGTATYTYTGELPSCVMPGLPRTGD